MQITIDKKIGQVEKGKVSDWRKNPGNLDLAASAALYYAQKQNKRMIVIPGDSYGVAVFHIANENKSISYFTIKRNDNLVVVVETNGEVFRAIASDV